MVLDWDDALPEDDLEASEQHASSAQVALCLGTSLQVRPANSLPLRTVKSGGTQNSGPQCNCCLPGGHASHSDQHTKRLHRDSHAAQMLLA